MRIAVEILRHVRAGRTERLKRSGAAHSHRQFPVFGGFHHAVLADKFQVEEAEILSVRFQDGLLRRNRDPGAAFGCGQARLRDLVSSRIIGDGGNGAGFIDDFTEVSLIFLDLLLLADEQEEMVDKYLQDGRMFVLTDNGVKGEVVVTDEGNGILEIKNIATDPSCHGKGYGKKLIQFVEEKFRGKYSVLQVGTGDSPLTIPFYEKCGFRFDGREEELTLGTPIVEVRMIKDKE